MAEGSPEELASWVLDAMTQAVVTTDVQGTVLHWNSGAQRLYGWTPEQAVGRGINELTLPDAWEPTAVIDAVADGRSWSGTFTAQHRDGERLRAAVTTTPVRDRDGAVVALVGVSSRVPPVPADVAARRELAAIVDSSKESIIGVDVNGVITSWNRAAEGLYQWSAGEVVGTSIYDLLPAVQATLLRLLFGSLAVGGPVADRETRGWRKDGSSFAVDLRLSAVRDDGGAVLGYAGIARDVSERAALRAAAEADRARLAAAQDLAHVSSCEVELATGRVTWSAETWRILGVPREDDATLDRFVEAVHPDDQPGVRASADQLLAGRAPAAQEFRVIRPDGEVRWIREVFAQSCDAAGVPVSVLGTKLDITEIRTAEQARRGAEAGLREGFDRSPIGMVTSDRNGVVTMVNGAFLRILGRSEGEVLGFRSEDWIHPDDSAHVAADVGRMLSGEVDTFESEHRVLRPDGTSVWVAKTVSVVRNSDHDPIYFLGQVQDVTARRAAEAELAHQAFHDPLTALPNRVLLLDRVEQALGRAGRSGTVVSALFLDLDQFKVVNDGLGHAAGDALLVMVADRLSAVVRPGDTLARFGGDEFVLVCEGVDRDDVELLGERVAGAVRAPFRLHGREVVVTLSTGIATAGPGADAESLLRDADAAMYKAKARGRNCHVVFDAAMHSEATARLDTESQLRHAVDRGELVLHYQPVLDLLDGDVVGVEALVRWQHPDRGLLAPGEFVALAEQTGLVVGIGEWVLNAAQQQVQRWRAELPGAQRWWVAVNVSARQVQVPGLVGTVAATLAASGLPSGALHLEMTESVVMNEGEVAFDVLGELRALGVRLAVDDFGTGYSSLSYLKRLPVDTLKIDRSFVGGLGGDDPHDSSIVHAVLSLAGSLGLHVVAEGVETQEQLAELQLLGVSLAQGHLWSRALAPTELAAWMRERSRALT